MMHQIYTKDKYYMHTLNIVNKYHNLIISYQTHPYILFCQIHINFISYIYLYEFYIPYIISYHTYTCINTTSHILQTRYHTPPTMLKSTPKKLLMFLAHLLTYNTLIALIFFTLDGSPLATYSVTIASRKRAIDLRCFQLASLGCIIHT